MAAIEETIYSGLSGHAGLTALVGTRVYPIMLPQNVTLPAVTYLRVGGARETAINEAPVAGMPLFQISSWATTYDGVLAVAQQVLAAVRALVTGSGPSLYARDLGEEVDLYEPETGLYQRVLDVTLVHGGAGA
mgnify:CR=1 FL=1